MSVYRTIGPLVNFPFRPQYYKLIEECITQIVLHRTGYDPDFRLTKRFEIDVEPLLSKYFGRKKMIQIT